MKGAGYARLRRDIWRNPDWLTLSRNGQWLYAALVSAPNVSACGVLPITLTRWANLAADTTVDDVQAALGELERGRFIVVDWSTEELVVRSYMRHDGLLASPNGRRAVDNHRQAVVSSALAAVLDRERARLDDERTNDQVTAAEQSPVEAPPAAPSPAPAESPSRGDGSPTKHEARSTKHTSRSTQHAAPSRQPSPGAPADDDCALGPAAAAAVDLFVEKRRHDLRLHAVRSPGPYFDGVRRREIDTHRAELEAVAIDVDPIDVAVDVLGLSRGEATEAKWRLDGRQVSA